MLAFQPTATIPHPSTVIPTATSFSNPVDDWSTCSLHTHAIVHQLVMGVVNAVCEACAGDVLQAFDTQGVFSSNLK